ncbi:S-norcoclaurine synthase [Apostasia shenzhenica]|uniref:S-norcoclaurine synthase n=1 Tax=Apostasia shenzhenica TaxID=1088818 RepID=A0A2I0ATI8_9ASPA|nr:S-norcoclaurine synthase [Apostasia shenzhenica]
MKGTLSKEVEIGISAANLWEVFRSLRLAELTVKLLPHLLAEAKLEEGYGGVGTILKLTLRPGILPAGLESYKEKFVKIDDEQRVKEAVVVEGGYLELGFQSYLVRFEIMEKKMITSGNEGDEQEYYDSAIVRSTIEYEISDEHAGAGASAELVSIAPLAAIAEAVGNFLAPELGREEASEFKTATIKKEGALFSPPRDSQTVKPHQNSRGIKKKIDESDRSSTRVNYELYYNRF